MGKAEHYRKRAAKLGSRMKSTRKTGQSALKTKQKALSDMADNEDWLDGKPGSGLKPDKK